MTLDRNTLEARITEYLGNGGLWNPELMDHAAVRDLLIDCRKALAAQQEQIADVGRPVKPHRSGGGQWVDPFPFQTPTEIADEQGRPMTYWGGRQNTAGQGKSEPMAGTVLNGEDQPAPAVFCPSDGDPCRRACIDKCELTGGQVGLIHSQPAVPEQNAGERTVADFVNAQKPMPPDLQQSADEFCREQNAVPEQNAAGWEEDALRYCKNSGYWRSRAEAAELQVAAAKRANAKLLRDLAGYSDTEADGIVFCGKCGAKI